MALVIGYDPGGNGRHGVAVLEVSQKDSRWTPISGLRVTAASSLREAVEWLDDICLDGRVVAAGVDTLTEWNSGPGGWRPADKWLQGSHPDISKSVVSPNYLSGSMAVNGAAFLTLLAPHFKSDGTLITEAHPKACYFALTGKKHVWAANKAKMVKWLLEELGVDAPDTFGSADHCFDAGVALLAALRGLNHEWTLDLHTLPDSHDGDRVQFFGQTHFWWPGPQTGSARRPE